MDNNLSVSIVKEVTKDIVKGKILKIDNETVALAETTAWENATWKDIQGNNLNFNAEWASLGVKEPHAPFLGEFIEINSSTWLNYAEKNMSLIFMSRYNGTHFVQAILTVYKEWNENESLLDRFVMRQANVSVNGWIFIFEGVIGFNNVTEINRTVYFGNSTESIYNPTRALYNSILAMRAHNYTFQNVVSILLVPREMIPNRFNVTAPFLWYIRFVYVEGYYDYNYRAIVYPNGTLLRLDVSGGYLPPPNDNNFRLYMTYIVVIIGGVVATSVVYYYFHRKKQKPSTKVIDKISYSSRAGKMCFFTIFIIY